METWSVALAFRSLPKLTSFVKLVDLFLSYTNGDIKLALSCDIKLKNIATVPVKAAIILKALAGKVRLWTAALPRLQLTFPC